MATSLSLDSAGDIVPWQLLDGTAETAGRVAMVAAILGTAVAVKAFASVLRTWIEQAFRTRRLKQALEGSRPKQRKSIITAVGRLEAASPSEERDRPAGEWTPPTKMYAFWRRPAVASRKQFDDE